MGPSAAPARRDLEAAVLLVRERAQALARKTGAEAGTRPRPHEASVHGAGRIGFGLGVPVGVVAAMSPFNYPLNLVAHKLAPATAPGCPPGGGSLGAGPDHVVDPGPLEPARTSR